MSEGLVPAASSQSSPARSIQEKIIDELGSEEMSGKLNEREEEEERLTEWIRGTVLTFDTLLLIPKRGNKRCLVEMNSLKMGNLIYFLRAERSHGKNIPEVLGFHMRLLRGVFVCIKEFYVDVYWDI